MSADVRPQFFRGVLAAVVRISRAFPALAHDVIGLLMLLARLANSHLATTADTMVTGDIYVIIMSSSEM